MIEILMWLSDYNQQISTVGSTVPRREEDLKLTIFCLFSIKSLVGSFTIEFDRRFTSMFCTDSNAGYSRWQHSRKHISHDTCPRVIQTTSYSIYEPVVKWCFRDIKRPEIKRTNYSPGSSVSMIRWENKRCPEYSIRYCLSLSIPSQQDSD